MKASVRTTNDPSRSDMKEVVLDASDPSRRYGLHIALEGMKRMNVDPNDYFVRSARQDEQLTGRILIKDGITASVSTGKELVVVDARDLPEQTKGEI